MQAAYGGGLSSFVSSVSIYEEIERLSPVTRNLTPEPDPAGRLKKRIAELEKENGAMRAEVKMKTVRLQDAKQKLAARQQELEQATACLGTLGM